MSEERRRARRHQVNFRIAASDGRSKVDGSVGNMSSSGVYLKTSTPMPLGTIVEIVATNNKDKDTLFVTQGRVVRMVPSSRGVQVGLGMEFVYVDEEQKQQIALLVSQMNNEAEVDGGTLDIEMNINTLE